MAAAPVGQLSRLRDQGDELSYEFNLVLTDDPARRADPNAGQDVVELLTSWHLRIVTWVYPTIFTALASP